MPWTDQPLPRPHRSEDELLDVVRRRAGDIRRRRWARLTAGVGTVVAVLGVATALARAGDQPSSVLHVVGPPATTSTSIAVTALPPLPLPTTTVPAPTTTRAPATSTTRRPAASTSTSTTVRAALRQCDAADVVVTAAPERPSYARTEQPYILITAVNRSSRPCQATYVHGVQFFDSAGRPAGGIGVSISAMADDVEGSKWAPGEMMTANMPGGLTCSDQECPPGTYTAVAYYGSFRSPPTTFTVT